MNATLSVWQVIGCLVILAFIIAGGAYLYDNYKVKKRVEGKLTKDDLP